MAINALQPSTNMLPMAEIADVLEKQYDFTKKDYAAKDTLAVAGTAAENIAVAASDDEGNIPDRETVKNALQLGGVDAEQYITLDTATAIKTFGESVAKIYADEVRSLRDELYQLRGQLVDQGLVRGYELYKGFQDLFKSDDIKYEFRPTCGLIQDSPDSQTIYPEAITEFEEGDWFIINKVNDFANPYNLVKVVAKNTNLGYIKFDPPVPDLKATYLNGTDTKKAVLLYKSLGQYNDSSFSFSAVDRDKTIEKEKLTMFNDDSNSFYSAKIQTSGTGYAVAFKVPDMTAGSLSKFTIKGRSVGAPGALICHVLTKEAEAGFKDLADAKNKGYYVAKSSLVQPTAQTITSTLLEFDFMDPATGKYPKLDPQRYLFVIEALMANGTGDHWFIDLSDASDIQRNNNTYMFVPSTLTGGNSLVTNADTARDMFFVLATKEIAPIYETPFKEGLYTAKISLPYPIDISRVRLALRINREGNYKVASSGGAYPDGSVITLSADAEAGTYNLSNGTGISLNETVVIGTTVRKAADINGSQIRIDKGMYIDKALVPDPNFPFDSNKDKEPIVPTYRVGYKVSLRRLVEEVETDTYRKLETKRMEKIDLPLVAVLPDKVKQGKHYSDRLIFEGEFRGEDEAPIYGKDFELQIKWASNFDKSVLDANKELLGRMFDLTVSFDKSL